MWNRFLVKFFVILSIGLFLLWIGVYLFFFENFKNINFRKILFSFIVVLNLYIIFSATLELLMGEWVLFDAIFKLHVFSIETLLDLIFKLVQLIKTIKDDIG